ncbi:hypothetical protein MHYP_G00218710 [Metynnis hypsauchen]
MNFISSTKKGSGWYPSLFGAYLLGAHFQFSQSGVKQREYISGLRGRVLGSSSLSHLRYWFMNAVENAESSVNRTRQSRELLEHCRKVDSGHLHRRGSGLK